MEIIFKNDFAHIANNQALTIKHFGSEIAKCLRRRLDDIDAASSLNDLKLLPGQISLHSKMNPAIFALKLCKDAELLLTPDPPVVKISRNFDWAAVKCVQILGVHNE